jgi:hypothetical protein
MHAEPMFRDEFRPIQDLYENAKRHQWNAAAPVIDPSSFRSISSSSGHRASSA